MRAWDWSKPLLVAPAMNTCMWDSPFTAQQLGVLSALGARIIPPVRWPPVRMQESVNLYVHVGLLGARIIPPVGWPP